MSREPFLKQTLNTVKRGVGQAWWHTLARGSRGRRVHSQDRLGLCGLCLQRRLFFLRSSALPSLRKSNGVGCDRSGSGSPRLAVLGRQRWFSNTVFNHLFIVVNKYFCTLNTYMFPYHALSENIQRTTCNVPFTKLETKKPRHQCIKSKCSFAEFPHHEHLPHIDKAHLTVTHPGYLFSSSCQLKRKPYG